VLPLTVWGEVGRQVRLRGVGERAQEVLVRLALKKVCVCVCVCVCVFWAVTVAEDL
jgi:hypothetical protein